MITLYYKVLFMSQQNQIETLQEINDIKRIMERSSPVYFTQWSERYRRSAFAPWRVLILQTRYLTITILNSTMAVAIVIKILNL